MKTKILFITCFFCSLMASAREEVKTDEMPELFAFAESSGKYGFRNLAGDVVVPPIYSTFFNHDRDESLAGPDFPDEGEFTCGLARVWDKDRGFGFVDYRGIEAIPCQYEWALPFNNGLAAVQNKEGKWGYIDTSGKVVVPLEYYVATMHREGFAFVGKQGKSKYFTDAVFAIIDNKGKILTDFVYEDVLGYPFFSEGIINVKYNGKRVAINTRGKVLFEYNGLYPHFYFSEGLCTCHKVGDRNGSVLIDKTGKIVFKSNYQEIRPFVDNFSIIEGSNGSGVINRNFKVVVEPKYRKIYIDKYRTDIFVVEETSGQWKFLKNDGSLAINNSFEEAYPFRNDLACVKKNGKYGYIDREGNFAIPAIYDYAYDFDDCGYTTVKRGDMYCAIDVEQVPLFPYTTKEVAFVKKENLSRLNAKSDVDVHIPKSELQNSGCLVLIIANERYAMGRVSNVQFAKNDGNGIKQYCINTLGVPEQNIMICQDATLSQIKAGVSWLQQKSNVGGYDKAIVYYAGHGIPDYTTSKSYILPSDGNPMDLATAYSLNEFYESLSFVKVKQCVAFIDACFSGTDRRGDAITEVRGISIKPTEPEPKGNVVVFSACSGDETAQPYPAKHHGVFTYYLLKYLQEKSGNVKCSDLYNYIRSNVSNSTLDISGKKQSPSVHVASRTSSDWMNWSLK